MTEQNTQTNAAGQPPKDSPPLLQEYGLLEQFNLPPKAIRFIRAHKRRIWSMVIACAAVALLVAGIDAFLDHRLKKAAEALDAAMQAGGEQQRELLAGVSRKYGSTPSAQWAEVTLARLDEEGGKPEEAIARYRKLQGKFPKNSPVQPLLLGKMAALEEQRQQWDAALNLYKSLSDTNDFAPDAFLGMARIHETRGNKDEALAMYRKFVEFTAVSTEETGVDPRRQMVMSHIELMQDGFANEPDLPQVEKKAEAATEAPAEPEQPAVAEEPAEPQTEATPEAPAASEEPAAPQAEATSETPATSEEPAAPQSEATPEPQATPEQAEAPQAPATSEQPAAPQTESTPEAPATPEQPAMPLPETPAAP